MNTSAYDVLNHAERKSIRLWVFKFINGEDVDSFGVCVEGYRPSDDTETVLRNWHSTAIERRITSSLLQTSSGSVYELRGTIDKDLAHHYGYPAELVELFMNGFPENWKSILKEYFYVVKTTNPMNASYYFSAMARRRSSNFVRGQNVSSICDSNKDDRRRERLSILPASTSLPVPIPEEDEQKENSVLNSSSASLKKTPTHVDERSERPSNRRSSRSSRILPCPFADETPKSALKSDNRSSIRRSSRLNGGLPNSPVDETPRLADKTSSRSSVRRSSRLNGAVSRSGADETPKAADESNNQCSIRRSSRLNRTLPDSPTDEVPESVHKSSNRSSIRRTRLTEILPQPRAIEEPDLAICGVNAIVSRLSAPKAETAAALREITASSESSYIFVPRMNSETSALPGFTTEASQNLDQFPTVESPFSVSSPSLEQETSAGPAFETPGCNRESNREDNIERNDYKNAKHSELAVVPVSSVVCKVSMDGISKDIGKVDDAVELRRWSIRFAPVGCGGPELGFPKFVLLGDRIGHDTQWRTSVIVRVESAEILHTSSTKYRLAGDMNVMDSASAGFPKMFVAKFLRGFPPDWRTQITILYNTFFGSLGVNDHLRKNFDENKSTVVFPQSPTREGAHDKDQCHTSPHDQSAHSLSAGCSRTQNSKNKGYVAGRGGENRADVRTSRSGRCVHPPLAQWAGQRVRYDGYGNVIGVQDVTTATIHSKGAAETLALSNYYGVSPARRARQSESFLEPPRLAVDSGPKKMPAQKALVTYSDSSNEENDKPYNRRFRRILNDKDSTLRNSRRRPYQTYSDESEFERELRAERRLILKQAKELRRQQANLLEMERRIAFHEEKWRKKKMRERRLEGSNIGGHYSPTRSEERRRQHRKQVKDEKQQMVKRYSKYADEEDRYLEEEILERQRREEEWAEEDEHLSDCDYSDGDVDWREPVRKRRRKLRRIREQISSDDNSLDSKESEEESDEHNRNKPRTEKPGAKREKGWNRAELDRLKLALSAIHVRTDDDWEKIARSLGNDRNPESCKQAAIKRLKWEPSANSCGPVEASEPITARAGTVAFQHQTNEYTRKYMMGGGAQGEDFFRNNETTMNDSMVRPDVTEFGADDSLLEAMRTPAGAMAERKVPNRRQFLAEAIDDDTPISRRSSGIAMITPRDSAQRERQNRYFHHLINKGARGDISRMNFSRAGCSRFERTRTGLDEIKVQKFGSLQEDLDYVAKMTKKARRNAVLEEDSDKDLELEDEDVEELENNKGGPATISAKVRRLAEGLSVKGEFEQMFIYTSA
ncbi:hypothetical protein RB195_017728 [Necator americanus]|uniref:SANTA domain-containing protein n=1 Tax=Necator americanus TaxID=51031 RepID=A0ABR1C7I9_NECAM